MQEGIGVFVRGSCCSVDTKAVIVVAPSKQANNAWIQVLTGFVHQPPKQLSCLMANA